MTTIIVVIAFLIIGYLAGYLYARKNFQKKEEEIERNFEQKLKETLEGSRSTIKGRVSENLALLIPDFQKQLPDLNSSEARFMGGPIDYLFFEGMDKKTSPKLFFSRLKLENIPA